jgi:hypothetical protein
MDMSAAPPGSTDSIGASGVPTTGPASPVTGRRAVADLLAAQASYRDARLAFLARLVERRSNRDPLAEFSERLVQALWAGTLAASLVQKGHDVVSGAGERVQVKFLANPSGPWVNGHTVVRLPGVHRYDVVFFDDLLPAAAVSFPLDRLQDECAALRKRHPNQDRMLQLTQANYRHLLASAATFLPLGVRLSAAPVWAPFVLA